MWLICRERDSARGPLNRTSPVPARVIVTFTRPQEKGQTHPSLKPDPPGQAASYILGLERGSRVCSCPPAGEKVCCWHLCDGGVNNPPSPSCRPLRSASFRAERSFTLPWGGGMTPAARPAPACAHAHGWVAAPPDTAREASRQPPPRPSGRAPFPKLDSPHCWCRGAVVPQQGPWTTSGASSPRSLKVN